MPQVPKEYQTINPQKLKQKDIVHFFGVVRSTVQEWVKDGLPCDNGVYDLKTTILWRIDQVKNYMRKEDDKDELDKERLRETIRKLQIDNADKEKKTIPRDRFEQIQREQAQALMTFVTDGYKRNSQVMMNKLGVRADKITDFNEVWDDFIKQMMDAFVARGKDV